MAAPLPAQQGPVVARSAQLTLTATLSDHALTLQVDRISDHRPIAGQGRITVTLDGHGVPVTALPGGRFLLSTRAESAGAHSLGVVVSHDGIRELLTGTVTVPPRRGTLELLQEHGMFSWWVLNIAVVLIAVMVIARRRS